MRVDDNGFVMPSKIHDSPDYSIVFLGGSTTECWLVPEKKRFPYLVGRLMEQATGRKINSYNAARSGGTSMHSINILLNKVIPLKVDVAVLMHNINDLSALHNNSTYWSDNPSRAIILREVSNEKTRELNWIRLFSDIRDLMIPHLYVELRRLFFKDNGESRFVIALIKSIFGRELAEEEKVYSDPEFVKGKSIDRYNILSQFKQSLRTFVEVCRVWNIRPVLMTQVSRLASVTDQKNSNSFKHFLQDLENRQGVTIEDYTNIYLEMNSSIREVAEEQNILLVDLEQQVTAMGAGQYIYDLIHFNEQGSVLVSELIGKDLLKVTK